MIRILVFVGLLVVVAAGVGVAFVPLGWTTSFLTQNVRGFSYNEASGSIWSGKLTNVQYRTQRLGDVSFHLDATELFGGRLGATVAFETADLAMTGRFAYGIFDHAGELTAISLRGRTARIPGLPPTLQVIPGDFRVELDSVMLTKEGGCASANGKIWTNMLARGALQLGWAGPEMSGPISCVAGRFAANPIGVAANGDTAEASLDMGADLKGGVRAMVTTRDQLNASKMAQAGFHSTQPGRWDLAIALGS
jgi:hypothetical protein